MSLYDGNEHGDDGSVHQLDQQSIADAHMQSMLAMNEASMLSDLSAGMLPVDFDPTGTSPHHLDDFTQDYEKDLQLQSDDPMDLQGLQSENEMSTSGVGAGPLPTGFGAGPAPGAGSILTDFTKRRNWSQRVVEELKDFLHILTPDGRFLYVSPSAKSLTGYHSTQLVGRFISDFLHSDDNAMFVREFNESIATGNPLRFFYRFKKFDGSYAIFESHGHPHLASEAAAFGPNSGASFCRGFFMMARPYPTKNAALLDSFLEHKIENERLRKRIADLKREEQEDLEGSQPRPVPAGKSESGVPGGPRSTTGDSTSSPANFGSMPPPAKPSLSSNALTRQNLDEALAASRPDSINDKMARYEGATHIETIEMLTGLRYRDGERSKGISTGAKSPSLIRGDAGIAIPVDKDGRRTPGRYTGSPYDLGSIDKKKRMKVADEYVCTDCGTLDSPEWRKGPSGPKTLCNACGLRWAKKEKRSKSDGKSSGNGNGNGNGNGSGNGHGHSSVKNSSQDTPMSESTRYSHGTQQHIQPGMASMMSQSQSSMSTPMGAQMSPMASMHSMQMAGVPNLVSQSSITPSSSSPLATMPVVVPGDPNQGNPGYS